MFDLTLAHHTPGFLGGDGKKCFSSAAALKLNPTENHVLGQKNDLTDSDASYLMSNCKLKGFIGFLPKQKYNKMLKMSSPDSSCILSLSSLTYIWQNKRVRSC